MFQKSTLPNGLRILTSTMSHTRSVTVAFFIGAGSRYETDEEAGAYHFVEHLCFKGTARRPTAREISETIEGVGGLMNGGTDREATIYWCKVARPHFDITFDLIADMLLNPLFNPQELQKERQVILEELAMTNDHPDSRLELLIDELLWPDQPMGRDVGGTAESVQGLSREKLLECMMAQYIPCNTVLAVAGDISHEEVVETAMRHLQGWPRGKPRPWFPAKDGVPVPRVKVEFRKTDQAHITLAAPAVPADHPDRYAVDLLSTVLGEGMSSRLFLELREQQALAYEVHSYVNRFLDCGAFHVYAGVRPKNAHRVVKEILGQLEKAKEGVTAQELAKAKELGKGRLLLRMEDTRSVAFWMGSQELLLNRVLTVDEVLANIGQVSPEDIQRMARQLLLQERFKLAVVGPYRSQKRFAALLEG